jgi:hypothetical protein
LLEAVTIGWRCKKCKGFISLQDGKFFEYVEKPFMPPQTHADRIRAMSDEELEEEFTKGGLCRYIQDHDNEFCDERGDCTNCIKEWLKQPVEDAEINA